MNSFCPATARTFGLALVTCAALLSHSSSAQAVSDRRVPSFGSLGLPALGGLARLSSAPPRPVALRTTTTRLPGKPLATLAAADDAAQPADENSKKAKNPKAPEHQHAVGVGISFSAIPHRLFATFLARYTTAGCRKGLPEDYAADGVLKNEGCSWGLDINYLYRHTKHFEIATEFGYRKLELPDGYWLMHEDWGPGCSVHGASKDCDLADAHYTEVDLTHLALGIDFIGRATVVKLPGFELQIGGGGGLRTLFFIGEGIYKTPLGMRPKTEGSDDWGVFDGRFPGSPSGQGCYNADHLADFTRCTPHWIDIDSVDQDGDGLTTPDEPIPDERTRGEGLFAHCDENGCDKDDLEALGTRQKAVLPKVLPLIRILVSVRMIAAEHYGLTLDGGWDTGFFFRSSIQYHF